MKFSSIFSVFLAALTVGVGASPIPSDSSIQETLNNSTTAPVKLYEESSLGKRNNPPVEETDTFKQFVKVHKDMKKDQYYAFTVKWTFGTAPGDQTPKEEMKQIQEKYGFDHIALAIGKVTEKTTTTGGKKNKTKKTVRDFDAHMYHLKTYEGLKTEFETPKWVYSPKQDGNDKVKIEFVKTTTDKKITSAKKKGNLSPIFSLQYVHRTNRLSQLLRRTRIMIRSGRLR